MRGVELLPISIASEQDEGHGIGASSQGSNGSDMHFTSIDPQ